MQLTSQFIAKMYKLNLKENSPPPHRNVFYFFDLQLGYFNVKAINKNNVISPFGIGTEIR